MPSIDDDDHNNLLPTDNAGFDRPVARQPKSPAKLAQLQAQNRRREYLRRHESYFNSLEHELADPILYERLVKRFQTPAERVSEGQAKGYGRTLEADLVRGETKLSDLGVRADGAAAYGDDADGDDDEEMEDVEEVENAAAPQSHRQIPTPAAPEANASDDEDESEDAADSEHLGNAWEGPVDDRAHGLVLWRRFLEERFIRGDDDEFDYAVVVDGSDEYDVAARREAEDAWFDDEEPSWVEGDGEEEEMKDEEDGVEKKGETGIQDF